MAPQLYDSKYHPSCFLLRLPPSIRRRIYLYLGVARCDGLPMLFDLDGPVNRSMQVAFRGLLLSCRLIYGEVSGLLFSSNRFVIHYRHMRGYGNDIEPSLQSLRNLTASSLASLASLKIVLNQTSCHHRSEKEASGECCDDIRYNLLHDPAYCREHHTAHHDKPLQSSCSMAEPMLDEWLRTADYLSPKINLGVLRLALVCDLDQEEADMDLVTRVVAPLSSLPELKDCHVRLCKSPDVELARIARNAALQACRRPEPSPSSSGGSRLLSLPRELRLHILEYTDLVTPWKEVMWTRRERGYQYPYEGCYPRCDIPCDSDTIWHHGCQFQGCYHQKRIQMANYEVYAGSIGCFCRLRHAAFSSACRCWAPPTPLFLICRSLSEDAKFVFYSLNRFVVSDTLASFNPCIAFNSFATFQYPNGQPPCAYPAERFAASQFLREVVPADCLSYLRFLELVFPPYNYKCWPYDGHPALEDWNATVDWVKHKITIPGLTLRLTMAGSMSRVPEKPDHRDSLSQAQGDEVLAGYDRILKSLACLGGEDGLAQFYADFAWPWKWTTWSYETRQVMGFRAHRRLIKSKEDVLNERAERFILGDRYERFSASKRKDEETPWMIQYSAYH